MNTSNYKLLSDKQKQQVIKDLYIKQKLSLGDIAEQLNTYPNKIRRDAKRFNITLRDKSDAQKNALKTGKHKHPTKGTQRDEETIQKIGLGVMQNWESMSKSEKQRRVEQAKEQWENLSEDQKELMQKKAIDAVRKSSKEGSKLEKFILKALLSNGYKVDFHKEQMLSNTKLQIDIFLPAHNIAIEVDGPSHFEPVWGDDALKRNQKYDSKKTGLLVGKGIKLIRVTQKHDFSKARASVLVGAIINTINEIISQKQSVNTIEIGD
jgi:very-short-patch-repair endonuclease